MTGGKGQRLLSWEQPGDWSQDVERMLQWCTLRLGTDESGAGATTVIVVHYDPGSRVEPHYHQADYCSIVVQGSITVTRREHGVGSMRVVKAGTAYGPLIAGPEGCTVIDVFATGVPDPSRSAINVYL